jgi:quercetin 2,3-dioxygenase
MIELRPFSALGRFRNGWLNARYHFSFAEYYDPARMKVGALRVWNDDEIAPGTGFDPHPHRDMEIITYVRAGRLTHQDNLGNVGHIEAGNVQVMHAGTGIVHAEYNTGTEPLRLFQIWVRPAQRGIQPGWQAAEFPRRTEGGLAVLASGRADDAGAVPAALPLYADAALLAGTLAAGSGTLHAMDPARQAYLVAASGRVTVNGTQLGPRDGAVITDEAALRIEAEETAELVMVDVA